MALGDQNTKYFHAFLKTKRNKQHIASILNEQGQLVTSYENIVEVFVRFFNNMLGEQKRGGRNTNKKIFEMGNRLSAEHQMGLIKPITKEEIKEAFFHIKDNKSAGPDEFGSCFFNEAWPIIKRK